MNPWLTFDGLSLSASYFWARLIENCFSRKLTGQFNVCFFFFRFLDIRINTTFCVLRVVCKNDCLSEFVTGTLDRLFSGVMKLFCVHLYLAALVGHSDVSRISVSVASTSNTPFIFIYSMSSYYYYDDDYYHVIVISLLPY